MTDIVTGATYTKESLFQELAILRERQEKLVEALVEAMDVLRVIPMSFPYNDRAQAARLKRHKFRKAMEGKDAR